VNKATFRNCLVSMRPQATKLDLPTTYNVATHIHNEFVRHLNTLKLEISVGTLCSEVLSLTTHLAINQATPGRVSTTTDLWTEDKTKASFIGITGHWIQVKDSEWRLRSEVVSFRGLTGTHSSGNIGRYFVRLSEHVGIITTTSSKVRLKVFLLL
jgi:hypothetical protein